MRDHADESDDADFAAQTLGDFRSDGYDDEEELKILAQIYHAEQVRNVAEQLSRVADAMEKE